MVVAEVAVATVAVVVVMAAAAVVIVVMVVVVHLARLCLLSSSHPDKPGIQDASMSSDAHR